MRRMKRALATGISDAEMAWTRSRTRLRRNDAADEEGEGVCARGAGEPASGGAVGGFHFHSARHDDSVERFEPLEEPHHAEDSDQPEHLDVWNALHACELGDERGDTHHDDKRVEQVLRLAPKRSEVIIRLGEHVDQELESEKSGENDLSKQESGREHALFGWQQLGLSDVDGKRQHDENCHAVLGARVLVQIAAFGSVV